MKKNIVFQISELVGCFIFLFFTVWFYDYLKIVSIGDFNSRPLLILSILFPFVFGILIRFPRLILRWKNYYGFNYIRFFIIVMPGVIIIFQYLIAVLFETKLWFSFSFNTMFYYLFSMWIGVSLLDCFKVNQKSID